MIDMVVVVALRRIKCFFWEMFIAFLRGQKKDQLRSSSANNIHIRVMSSFKNAIKSWHNPSDAAIYVIF